MTQQLLIGEVVRKQRSPAMLSRHSTSTSIRTQAAGDRPFLPESMFSLILNGKADMARDSTQGRPAKPQQYMF